MIYTVFLLIMTIISVITFVSLKDYDMAVTFAYLGLSLTTGCMVITLLTPAKTWNKDLFNIMRFSKKNKMLQLVNKEHVRKTNNKIKEDSVEYIGDEDSGKLHSGINGFSVVKYGMATAGLGFIERADGASLKKYCCSVIPVAKDTLVKRDLHVGSYDFFRTVMDQQAIKEKLVSDYYYADDNKYICSYDKICESLMGMMMNKLVPYIISFLIIAVLGKILWQLFNVCKDPVSSVSVESIDTDGSKRTVTKNKYISPFRIGQCLITILLWTGLILLLFKFASSTPTVTAERIPISKYYIKNGIRYNCEYDTDDYHTYCYPVRTVDMRVKREVEEMIIPPSLNCIVDPVLYVTTGSLDGECVYEERAGGMNVTFSEPLNIIGQIDKRCYSISNIINARVGRSACVKDCKLLNGKESKCRIDYNPNNEYIQKNVTAVERLEVDLTGFTQKTGDDVTTISNAPDENDNNNTVSRKRRQASYDVMTSYGEGSYVLPNGFVTQYLTDDANGGSVFISESNDLDSSCNESNEQIKYASCTHGRRQVISCEPNLIGTSTVPSNTFTCAQPIRLNGLPEWRKSNPNINFNVDDDTLLAGEFNVPDFESDLGLPGLVSVGKAQVSVMYARRDQDNVQNTGNVKYFVYSFILKVKATPTFFNTYINRCLRANMVDNTNQGYSVYRFATDTRDDIQQILPLKYFIDLVSSSAPEAVNMYQDRTSASLVVKQDFYDETGKSFVYNPNLSGGCKEGTDGKCTMIVPLYYAFRLYGPVKALIKIMNTPLEYVYLTTNVCSSVNAIKVKNICYFPDFDYVSTEVVASGYPMTKFSLVSATRHLANYVIPSFYTNHPKISSGQYMAKVSSSANKGYYSTNGKCSNVHTDPNTNITMCDGKPAFNIDIVMYTTFHRPLSSTPNCELLNNTINCEYKDKTSIIACNHYVSTSGVYGEPSCITMTNNSVKTELDNHASLTLRSANMFMQIHRGAPGCENCIMTFVVESYYRCTWCTLTIAIVLGFGFVMTVLFVCAIIFGYMNGYVIGKLMRKMNITCCLSGYTRPVKCDYCSMKMFSKMEELRHEHACRSNKCPICFVFNGDKDIVQLQFKNSVSFKHHMKLHKCIRINPVLGFIKVLRSKTVPFVLVLLISGSIAKTSALTFDHNSAMRNNLVGLNVTLPNDILSCTNEECGIVKSYKLNVPLTHNSAAVVSTTKNDIKYSTKIVFKNPTLETSCDFKYVATSAMIGEKVLAYSCKTKTDCKTGINDYMKPISDHNGDEYVAFDTKNPLKGGFCPIRPACLSPIVDVFWFSAGCATINDGTAMGTEYYLPKVRELMMSVFECTVNSISYTHCDNQMCSEVNNEKSLLESGNVVFDHINQNVPTTFMLGALSMQGDTIPHHLFIGMPKNNEDSDEMLSYRMNKVPTGETCLDGTSFDRSSCLISTSGSHPSMVCSSTLPEITHEKSLKRYDSLIEQYHCNVDKTFMSWKTSVMDRTITVGSNTASDTQTYSVPSIDLKMDYCSLGYTSIDIVSLNDIKLKQVVYDKEIKGIKCNGLYNRNHMTMLTFDIELSEGILEMHCPDVFSEVCLIDTSKYKTCNVTTMLAMNNTCSYNGNNYVVDCSNLVYSEPDPSSSTYGFRSGSTELNSWQRGFKIYFTKWWGKLTLFAAIVLIIVLLYFTVKFCMFSMQSRRSANQYSKSLRIENDFEGMDIDKMNYNKYYSKGNGETEPRRRYIQSDSSAIFRSKL